MLKFNQLLFIIIVVCEETTKVSCSHNPYSKTQKKNVSRALSTNAQSLYPSQSSMKPVVISADVNHKDKPVPDKDAECAILAVKQFLNEYNVDNCFYGALMRLLQNTTDDELKKFGYTSHGIRKRLLTTISKLQFVPHDIAPKQMAQPQYE